MPSTTAIVCTSCTVGNLSFLMNITREEIANVLINEGDGAFAF